MQNEQILGDGKQGAFNLPMQVTPGLPKPTLAHITLTPKIPNSMGSFELVDLKRERITEHHAKSTPNDSVKASSDDTSKENPFDHPFINKPSDQLSINKAPDPSSSVLNLLSSHLSTDSSHRQSQPKTIEKPISPINKQQSSLPQNVLSPPKEQISSRTDEVANSSFMPKFEFDRYFLSWLHDVQHSIIISSYKTHNIFCIGHYVEKKGDSKLSIWYSNFNRPMGLTCHLQRMWIASSGNLWRFENAGKVSNFKDNLGEFDANYVARKAYFSSDIDTHDLCVDKNDNVYYCSALFSCICTPSDTHTFKVYWKPPWISKIAPEDRCHLNGLCLRDGIPRYVSSICRADVGGSWKNHRANGGVIWDIVNNEAVCTGLCMPHSPRWHDGKVWVLESGAGYFGYVENGKFLRKCFIPGYLRGLAFIGNQYAVVGSSQDRHENIFQDIPLGQELSKRGGTAQCGVFVINLETFDIIHHITFSNPIVELYDVCVIPGVTRPKITEVGDERNLRDYRIEY